MNEATRENHQRSHYRAVFMGHPVPVALVWQSVVSRKKKQQMKESRTRGADNMAGNANKL